MYGIISGNYFKNQVSLHIFYVYSSLQLPQIFWVPILLILDVFRHRD